MQEQSHRDGSLSGQVAVVTGSTRGIGAGIAKKFGEHGGGVVVHGREREQGEKVVGAITSAGGEASLVVGDLRDEAHCRSVIRYAVERFGRLDILVNNAGVVDRGNIENTSIELWEKILLVILPVPFILSQSTLIHI